MSWGPPQTGYEVVTVFVDGEVQRDSVLVTVVPAATLEAISQTGDRG